LSAIFDNAIVIFDVLFRQLIWLMMPAHRTQEILLIWKNIDIDNIIKHKAEFFKSLGACLKDIVYRPRLPVTAHEVFSFKGEYVFRRNLIAWYFSNPTNPVQFIDIIPTPPL
jgi:hypothetical protein